MGTDAPTSTTGSIRRSFSYAAPGWRVFDALTQELDAWWCHRRGPEHRYTIEPAVGGRLLETGAGELSNLATVSGLEIPTTVRLEGHLLLPGSVHNVVTLRVGGSTGASLRVDHVWDGDVPLSTAALRHSWGELLGGSLREFVDEGWFDVGRSWRPKYPMWAAAR
jgi:uncharacterized protein YndB with AHSA1/START domain